MHLDRLDVAVAVFGLLVVAGAFVVLTASPPGLPGASECATLEPLEQVRCFAGLAQELGINACLESNAPDACAGLYAFQVNASACDAWARPDSCRQSYYEARLEQGSKTLNADAILFECQRIRDDYFTWRCLELHARSLKDARFCQAMARADVRVNCLNQLEATAS